MTSDYERGFRTTGAIAVQIDRTLDRLLRDDVDREQLWPLLYEYRDAEFARANPTSADRIADALERIATIMEDDYVSQRGRFGKLPKVRR